MDNNAGTSKSEENTGDVTKIEIGLRKAKRNSLEKHLDELEKNLKEFENSSNTDSDELINGDKMVLEVFTMLNKMEKRYYKLYAELSKILIKEIECDEKIDELMVCILKTNIEFYEREDTPMNNICSLLKKSPAPLEVTMPFIKQLQDANVLYSKKIGDINAVLRSDDTHGVMVKKIAGILL